MKIEPSNNQNFSSNIPHPKESSSSKSITSMESESMAPCLASCSSSPLDTTIYSHESPFSKEDWIIMRELKLDQWNPKGNEKLAKRRIIDFYQHRGRPEQGILSLENLSLTSLPPCLKEFPFLKTLLCQNNQICPFITGYPYLETLVCDHNNITRIAHMNRLTFLVCHNNPITKFSSLPVLQNVLGDEKQQVPTTHQIPPEASPFLAQISHFLLNLAKTPETSPIDIFDQIYESGIRSKQTLFSIIDFASRFNVPADPSISDVLEELKNLLPRMPEHFHSRYLKEELGLESWESKGNTEEAINRICNCYIKQETSLDISNLGLTTLPSSLTTFSWVQSLNCFLNSIQDLSKLPPNVEHLNCSFGRVSFLPEELPFLKSLYCQQNFSLERLPKIPKVTELSFAFCNIAALPSAPCLQTIDCEGTPYFDSCFSRCRTIFENWDGRSIFTRGESPEYLLEALFTGEDRVHPSFITRHGRLLCPDSSQEIKPVFSRNLLILIKMMRRSHGSYDRQSLIEKLSLDQWENVGKNRETAINEILRCYLLEKSHLNLANLGLSSLPSSLPKEIKTVDCRHNNLTKIDLCGLVELQCSHNPDLKTITLDTLQILDCSHTNVSRLKSPISSLTTLSCSNSAVSLSTLSPFSHILDFVQKFDFDATPLRLMMNEFFLLIDNWDGEEVLIKRENKSVLYIEQMYEIAHTEDKEILLWALKLLQEFSNLEREHREKLQKLCNTIDSFTGKVTRENLVSFLELTEFDRFSESGKNSADTILCCYLNKAPELNLSHHGLTIIPPILESDLFEFVTSLNVSHNRLTEVSRLFLDELLFVDISYNHIRYIGSIDPDLEICYEGNPLVHPFTESLDYLRSLLPSEERALFEHIDFSLLAEEELDVEEMFVENGEEINRAAEEANSIVRMLGSRIETWIDLLLEQVADHNEPERGNFRDDHDLASYVIPIIAFAIENDPYRDVVRSELGSALSSCTDRSLLVLESLFISLKIYRAESIDELKQLLQGTYALELLRSIALTIRERFVEEIEMLLALTLALKTSFNLPTPLNSMFYAEFVGLTEEETRKAAELLEERLKDKEAMIEYISSIDAWKAYLETRYKEEIAEIPEIKDLEDAMYYAFLPEELNDPNFLMAPNRDSVLQLLEKKSPSPKHGPGEGSGSSSAESYLSESETINIMERLKIARSLQLETFFLKKTEELFANEQEFLSQNAGEGSSGSL